MNIYFVKRTNEVHYEEFESFVCIAESEQQARDINPSGFWDDFSFMDWNNPDEAWVYHPDFVEVQEIGKANEDETQPRVVCASFNAG